MCGVSTARAAADYGLSVVLVDAHSIGHGATGRSAGHVMTGFLPSPAEMSTLVGTDAALRFQIWAHESKLALRRRLIELGLGQTIRDGYLLTGNSPSHRSLLDDIANYWSRHLDIDGVRVLTGRELIPHIQSPAVDCALFDPSAYTIDPVQLVDGLRRLCKHPGITMQERTTVVRIAPQEPSGYCIETSMGHAIASKVAVCTGAHSLHFLERHFSPMLPTRTAVMITEPVQSKILATILPTRLSGSDCGNDPDYWTVTHDLRLLFGCTISEIAIDIDNIERELRLRFTRFFPTLAHLPCSLTRTENVDSTPTGLPFVREVLPKLFVAHGFSGVGLAASYGAGRVMAASIADASAMCNPDSILSPDFELIGSLAEPNDQHRSRTFSGS